MRAAEQAWLFQWRAAIKNSARSSTERAIAHATSDFGDEHGNRIFPSAARIAHDTAFSERTIYAAWENLARDGWIQKTKRYNSEGQTSTLFTLAIPKGFVPDPYVPTRSETEGDSGTETERPSGTDSVTETDRAVTETDRAVTERGSGELSSKNSPENSPYSCVTFQNRKASRDREDLKMQPSKNYENDVILVRGENDELADRYTSDLSHRERVHWLWLRQWVTEACHATEATKILPLEDQNAINLATANLFREGAWADDAYMFTCWWNNDHFDDKLTPDLMVKCWSDCPFDDYGDQHENFWLFFGCENAPLFEIEL